MINFKLATIRFQPLKVEKSNVAINNMISKIVAIFFITIIVVFPLVTGYQGYVQMTFAKTLFFWIATGMAAAAILFMLICVKGKFNMDNYYIENEPKRRIIAAELVLLAFIGWSYISSMLSMFQNPVWRNWRGGASAWLGACGRYEGFITFMAYALTFILIARFYKPRRYTRSKHY